MRRPSVCVVGPGWRFTSGISHFTCLLAAAMADHADTSVLLIRRLLPRFCYPGRARVGVRVTTLDHDPRVTVYDGIDWFWIPSLFRAIHRLREWTPDTLLLQWWTGTVAHTYLVLAVLARRRGARIVIEFHEIQDTGEARIPLVSAYTRLMLRVLLRHVDGLIAHSEHDRDVLARSHELGDRPIEVVAHGPFGHYRAEPVPSGDGAIRLLFFGLIRPYKGLGHLVAAFDRLTAEEASRYRLTIVGETWEGHTEPLEMVARSPHRDRITVVNRYVTDDEAIGHFSRADALVLPYLRSSASGPLHIAMSNGLPVIVSEVGGLAEVARTYLGSLIVPPADEDALLAAIRRLPDHVGRTYPDPHSWQDNVKAVLRCGRPAHLTGVLG